MDLSRCDSQETCTKHFSICTKCMFTEALLHKIVLALHCGGKKVLPHWGANVILALQKWTRSSSNLVAYTLLFFLFNFFILQITINHAIEGRNSSKFSSFFCQCLLHLILVRGYHIGNLHLEFGIVLGNIYYVSGVILIVSPCGYSKADAPIVQIWATGKVINYTRKKDHRKGS